MPYQCRLVDPTGKKSNEFEPGDMWYAPWLVDDDMTTESILSYEHAYFSNNYARDWLGKRPPIIVCLPGGHHWMVDQVSTNGREGWKITGEAPNITASPSIVSANYHGWLQNGVLSDDIEGRTY